MTDIREKVTANVIGGNPSESRRFATKLEPFFFNRWMSSFVFPVRMYLSPFSRKLLSEAPIFN